MTSGLENYMQLTTSILAEFSKEQTRAELIRKVTKQLNLREALLPAIQPPFSAEEQLLGKKLVTLDRQLKPLLEKMKQDIQQDLKKVVKKKASMKQYINPYQSLQLNDGRFYDRTR
ncbi:flagellar protein FliT [Heyndrickxia acidiproducens]|uniref:flagellar protein FliT n=1 Tax=Heyndrickxia acidiproducens TaxID=1121084 RepID=UPI0003605F01|nr:flagellar protein FliT [Heyndrickxia acidiproducens]